MLVLNAGPAALSVPSYICNKLGNVTIADTHPSVILRVDCCPPHRLNNPTLNPSPDPAALIGPGRNASRPLIGGEAEQQAAGWTVRPPTEATWNNNRGSAPSRRLEQRAPERLTPHGRRSSPRIWASKHGLWASTVSCHL